jgi:hypothetical protein
LSIVQKQMQKWASVTIAKFWLAGCVAIVLSGCGGSSDRTAEVLRKPLSTSSSSYNRDDIYRFFIVAFGAAPGTTYMAQAVAAADGGASIRQIVNTFTTKSAFLDTYPASLTDLAFAQRLTENIVGASATAAAKEEAVQDIVAALRLPGMTRGDIVYVIFNNLANKPTSDPTWGKTALKLSNQVAYAKFFTDLLSEETTEVRLLRAMVANINESSPLPDLTPKNIEGAWSLTQISSAGTIRSDAPGCGSYDIVAKGDLNNDGHEDILIGPKGGYIPSRGCNDPGFTKPIIAYYDPRTKEFSASPATQAIMPEMQWTQVATIGDFNGDGYNDIFAVGTGTDYGTPCGEAPILLLGSNSGLINMSHLLPRFSGYGHQAAWGDFNGDGKTDFVILNNNWVPTDSKAPKYPDCFYRRFPGTNDSYLVMSTGNTWNYSSLRVADKQGNVLINGNQNFNSAVAGDVNNDGKVDLIVVGGNGGSLRQQTLTLLGDGQGGFLAESVFEEKPFGDNTVGVNLSLKQLNSSGPPEMIMNFTEHPGGQAMPFQKSIFKVFSLNTITSQWSNVSNQYITNKDAIETDLTYCARFYWTDINSDGRDDFVCAAINQFQLSSPFSQSPRIWLRAGDGTFVPAYHKGFNIINRLGSPTPVRVDGKIKIVGLKLNSYRGPITLELAE